MSSEEGSATAPAEVPSGCVGPSSDAAGKASACAGCPSQSACASGKYRGPDPDAEEVKDRLAAVRHKILVLSGKGGVGKSSVAAQLAWALSSKRKAVGVLDIDICGPSQPRMLGVETAEVHRSAAGWSPVYASEYLSVMSVAFMLSSKTDAVIWRGPRKNGLIKQFLTEVDWDELDFLVVDSPPGTSDEHLSIASLLKGSGVDGAILVTTPQEVSLLDVRKEVTFCRKVGIPIIGIVENMSGFACKCCGAMNDIYGAEEKLVDKMCEEMGVPLLGRIPLDPRLLRCCDTGKSFVEEWPSTPAATAFWGVIENVMSSSAELKETWTRSEDES